MRTASPDFLPPPFYEGPHCQAPALDYFDLYVAIFILMCRDCLRRSCSRFVHGRRPSLNRSRWAKGEQLRPHGIRAVLSILAPQSCTSFGLAGYPKRAGQSACHHLLSVSVTGYRSPHAVYAPSALSKPNSEKHPICGNGQLTFINPGGCRALLPTA